MSFVEKGHILLLNEITNVITAIVVMYIYIKEDCSDIKLSWIMVILIFPIMGLCLFIMYGSKDATKRKLAKIQKIDAELEAYMLETSLQQDNTLITQLEQTDFAVANQARYISNYGKAPLYRNTDVVFYKDAKDGFEAQLADLKKAKEFIFMEYHAIEDAEAFDKLKEVLARKAAEGVEVRIFYDDVGSIGFINPEFIKEMRKQGIQCRIFNRIIPVLQIFMNNRDHRKITVIDNKVGFTGGYNLADEYFNIVNPYGYWKDTGIRMEGDAVMNLTVAFLELWNFIEKTDSSYDKYIKQYTYTAKETGYIQPYADNPLDDERVGENVYMNMIKNAKKYIYFMTPYLILSNEMIRELTLAAKRGVDVRIITPGIPDKKLVYRVTRSYYPVLMAHGVQIYEFTPGFCHAKQCICDDELAVIGTINLDYRSMYHHFENAVWMYQTKVIPEIKDDFIETFDKCNLVTDALVREQHLLTHLGNAFLRLFSTLL
ncbi:MAG: cardiolipin synthase [Lachnospiraceae bacterium]|nr:cardiolipin synthase [Lachnospiraceae bacterium]